MLKIRIINTDREASIREKLLNAAQSGQPVEMEFDSQEINILQLLVMEGQIDPRKIEIESTDIGHHAIDDDGRITPVPFYKMPSVESARAVLQERSARRNGLTSMQEVQQKNLAQIRSALVQGQEPCR